MSYFTMLAEESCKIDITMRWQNRFLVYREQFSGNVSDNLVDGFIENQDRVGQVGGSSNIRFF